MISDVGGVVHVLEEAEHVIVGGAHVVRGRQLYEVHAEVGGQPGLVGGLSGAELGHAGGGGHPAVGDLHGLARRAFATPESVRKALSPRPPAIRRTPLPSVNPFSMIQSR